MARGPHLLLLDEPLDSFDAERSARFVELLREGGSPLAQVFLLGNQEQLADSCDLAVTTALGGNELHASGAGVGEGAPAAHDA
jgi:ABC-type sulfate/molybdate transport systems ATPase subunit